MLCVNILHINIILILIIRVNPVIKLTIILVEKVLKLIFSKYVGKRSHMRAFISIC